MLSAFKTVLEMGTKRSEGSVLLLKRTDLTIFGSIPAASIKRAAQNFLKQPIPRIVGTKNRHSVTLIYPMFHRTLLIAKLRISKKVSCSQEDGLSKNFLLLQSWFFLNREWQDIGTKLSLRSKIAANTGMPIYILQGGDLHSASIAQRMSWASKRKTTRIEDLAYCLMGIFDVNMPMLYGEGGKALGLPLLDSRKRS
jgi:hypothetical protein